MIFAKQRVDSTPLRINYHQIEAVTEYKYLGIALDAPLLNWKKKYRISYK